MAPSRGHRPVGRAPPALAVGVEKANVLAEAEPPFLDAEPKTVQGSVEVLTT